MKRHILRILLCLFLGVVVTFGLAWSCAFWNPNFFNRNPVEKLNESHIFWWQSRVPTTWKETPGGVTYFMSFGRDDYLYYEYSDEEVEIKKTLGSNVGRTLVGFPFRCMEGATFVDRNTRRSWTDSISVVNVFGFTHRNIPTKIRWFGLVADILFWAVLFPVSFAGVSKLKRKYRKRKGHCPFCNYDLKDDLKTGCPECGWNREENIKTSKKTLE